MGLFSKKSAPQPSARPEYIEVGQIVNTHGVRGEVKVQPWDVSAGQLCGFRTFYMDGEPFRPTSKRVQGEMVLMKLPEIDDMDTAAALKRKVLSIRRAEVQLKPGEHFDAEIVGMTVYNYFPHTYIGTVVDVLSYPAHKLYKVKGEEKTYLIPAVKDIFITNVDEEAREISVHMIDQNASDPRLHDQQADAGGRLPLWRRTRRGDAGRPLVPLLGARVRGSGQPRPHDLPFPLRAHLHAGGGARAERAL